MYYKSVQMFLGKYYSFYAYALLQYYIRLYGQMTLIAMRCPNVPYWITGRILSIQCIACCVSFLLKHNYHWPASFLSPLLNRIFTVSYE
ncbi:hypothetical protein FKM82_006161 [Ascaphus truei]